jgi:hypothetical protein
MLADIWVMPFAGSVTTLPGPFVKCVMVLSIAADVDERGSI